MLTQGLIILCLKIFFCRIIDVSMATFRTIMLVRGRTKTAALIGLVETLVWFLIVREALDYEATSQIETLIIY